MEVDQRIIKALLMTLKIKAEEANWEEHILVSKTKACQPKQTVSLPSYSSLICQPQALKETSLLFQSSIFLNFCPCADTLSTN